MVSGSVDCYAKAVELLARRTHFRRQLEDKLLRRGYSRHEVEAAVARLIEHGYLDDRRAAREFVGERLRRGPLGARRLRQELDRRGAPAAVIAEVVSEMLPRDDTALAQEAARRWRRAGRRESGALARHLDRKGFSQRAILAVLEALESERAEADLAE